MMDKSIASRFLYCPACCKHNRNACYSRKFAQNPEAVCCVVKATPIWTFPMYSKLKESLGINYTEKVGNATVVTSSRTNISYYEIELFRGHLSSFPNNICEFSTIVATNFSGNNIENLPDLCCIKLLDTLDLSWNKLTVIRSHAFRCLQYLRHLRLSNNLISYVEPGTFNYRPGSLMYVDLSWNRLASIDISNVVLGYWFRDVDFSYNEISKFTNKLGFQGIKMVGGGIVRLKNNRLTELHIVYQMLSQYKRSVLKLLFNYEFDLDNNPWICDCTFFILIKNIIIASRYYHVTDLTCESPSYFSGYNISKFRNDSSLHHLLICNLTMKEKCPPKCYCFRQPSKSRTVVNCSSTNRTEMPNTVPDLDDLDIDLSHNMIQSFKNHSYLQRTFKINLSYNRIVTIDPSIYGIEKLESIDIRNNRINSLHKSLQLKRPDEILFGNITLKCRCEIRWIRIWLERKDVQNHRKNIIKCTTGSDFHDMSVMSDNEICPQENHSSEYILFSAVTFIIFSILVCYYNFKYECKLFIRSKLLNVFSYNNRNEVEYDVYLSFNVHNDDIRQWTVRVLDMYLKEQGYKVCLPPRDFDVGGIHVDQIHATIPRCQSFIILLSQDYQESQLQTIEWNHIWNTFKSNRNVKLIVINYDILKSKKVQNRKLKAVIRLGYAFDFCNFDNCLLSNIEAKLSPPN